MLGSDILNECRNILGSQSQNRFPDSMLLRQASIIQRMIGLELDFPEATVTYNVVGGQQEYQLDTLSKILRVYIKTSGGSTIELYPTDIPRLEGDLLEAYDNTSGVVLGAPVQSPQWLTQAPSAYPMPNVFVGGTVPTTFPYGNTVASNQRPCYYLRGGYLGVLPPDVAASGDTIKVDCIPTPPDLTSPSTLSIFPRTFIMAIVWGVVKHCRMSDQNAVYAAADAEMQKEMERLTLWRSNKLAQNKPKTFIPRTVRTDFRPGYGVRTGWGGDW
jgi:hypothetical protein